MKITTDYHQFIVWTGMIISNSPLKGLPIEPCDAFGGFTRQRIADLQRFCQTNPDFHIVSRLNPNVILNRLATEAWLFHLARGDRDHRIIYDATASDDDLEIAELRAAKATS